MLFVETFSVFSYYKLARSCPFYQQFMTTVIFLSYETTTLSLLLKVILKKKKKETKLLKSEGLIYKTLTPIF